MLRRTTLAGALCLTAGMCPPAFCFEDDDFDGAAVYTMTNASASNSVIIFRRLADGTLKPAGIVPSGGRGAGAGLGTQGAIRLSDSHRRLFVVNAGSDDITVFEVEHDGLESAGTFPSGGHMPVSITVHG